jgi:hypothetical protein
MQFSKNFVFSEFSGDNKAVERPDPIPNSAVKHCLANGSGCIASARVGCRQIYLKPNTKVLGFFYWGCCRGKHFKQALSILSAADLCIFSVWK